MDLKDKLKLSKDLFNISNGLGKNDRIIFDHIQIYCQYPTFILWRSDHERRTYAGIISAALLAGDL